MLSKLIKIPGKTWFDDLTPAEVGLMIESFLSDGNSFFDPLAFNDFLHARLTDPKLIQIQSELNKNSFIPASSAGWPTVNKDYLATLAKDLRGDEQPNSD